MSSTHTTAPAARHTGARTTPAGRMAALARAELILFTRSKGPLVAAVFVPLLLPFSVYSATKGIDLKDTGLTLGLLMLPSSISFTLLFAVYTTLVGVFVARREQLVLKRLRTGELRDTEILAGSALPAVATGLAQTLILVAACTALLGVPAPHAPHLAVIGVLLGLVMCCGFAAVTAAWTRTTESAQVTSVPLVLISAAGSGIVLPLQLLPDRLAAGCELLPLSPVIILIRGGWSGELSTYEALRALAIALAWTGATVFAVRRWFRWEPRR